MSGGGKLSYHNQSTLRELVIGTSGCDLAAEDGSPRFSLANGSCRAVSCVLVGAGNHLPSQ